MLREKIVRDEGAVEAKLTELRARCASLSSREARAGAASMLGTGRHRCGLRSLGSEARRRRARRTTYGFARAFSKEKEHVATLAELERILNEEVKS